VTPEQTILLVRLVAAACPQQAIDRYTPDAWHELLSDLRFEDCREAFRVLGQRQAFIAPSEIRTEVRRRRADRAARAIAPAPAPEPTDTPGRYKAELERNVQRLADGYYQEDRALPPGQRRQGPPPAEYAEARARLNGSS
jgi:hypothetical protein